MKIDILKKQIFSTTFPTRISNILKYFLSETIHAQENGSRGTHFAKFLISNFLKSLTYSALSLIEKYSRKKKGSAKPRLLSSSAEKIDLAED